MALIKVQTLGLSVSGTSKDQLLDTKTFEKRFKLLKLKKYFRVNTQLTLSTEKNNHFEEQNKMERKNDLRPSVIVTSHPAYK